MMNFVTGQAVLISVDEHSVEGVVELASPNGKSLVLNFDAGLWVDGGMYAGQMPVLRGEDGIYRDLITDQPVNIEPRP